MEKAKVVPETVDQYIGAFPADVKKRMQQLRKTIKAAAPKADELISYQMPGYKYFGMLVYFAAYKNHIGFYPGAGGVLEFYKKLSSFKSAKGSVQFPHDRPIPYDVISKIVKFRVKQNEEKLSLKKSNGKK
ncbi:MAG TPA: DUF1801 domain-containing protein [Chitinophagaceae bacterium]|nr:DUF1801 domain-containing protein [Chitinophagaceae bacterium]